MLLCELFEARPKLKLKSNRIKKKLKVKQKRHRHHVRPVKKVTDEGLGQAALNYVAGKVLAKLSTNGV